MSSIRSRLGALKRSVFAGGAVKRELADIKAAMARHNPAVAYLGDKEAVVTTTWGCRLVIRTDDYILSPELMSTGTYESGLTKLLPQLLQQGATVIDVGANIGYYSVLAGQAVGANGYVIAFEPHPETARLLQVNLVMNHMWMSSKVEICAAYSHETQLDFFARGRFASNSSLAPVTQAELDQLGDTQERMQVKAIDLDSYAQAAGRGSIQLLKIDAEGSELRVIEGADRILREARPRLVVEWSPGQQERCGYTPGEFVDRLRKLAYDVAVIDSSSGALTRVEFDTLLTLDYANLLLVPTGSPLIAN